MSSEYNKFALRLVPMPKELSVAGVRTLRLDEVGVTHALPITPALTTALARLKSFAPASVPTRFVLRLALTGLPEAPPALSARLRALPNSAQAYAITPLPTRLGVALRRSLADEDGLLLLANTDTGLFYAALTLAQLISEPVNAQAEIPLVNVVDWPDMLERGQWGGNAENDLTWTSQWKLNVLEAGAAVRVEPAGRRPVAGIRRELIRQGRELGMKVVPFIMHLEQIAQDAGIMDRRDITSTPDPAKPLPSDYVPGLCMSSPATQTLVAQWLDEISAIEGVPDIMVWLSEDASPCFCHQCVGKEPYELEVRLLLNAFQSVRRRHPSARLRLLTTQGSFQVNDKILALIPQDVGVTYYDGGRTYDSSHRPMIYPLLEEYARSGRWLGVYPQITHSWRAVWPWTAPQFIRFRAQEFVTKGLSCVIGYAVPSNRFHEFNVMALAEWTWNAQGRTPEEFARAYATVKGFRDPDIFARWAMQAGNAGWDLAESRLFLRLIYEPEIGLKKDKPPFDHRFEHSALCVPERLQEGVAAAKEALALARQAGVPDMIDESECLLAGLTALEAIRSLSQAIHDQALAQAALPSALKTLDSCAAVLQTRLMRWGRRISSATMDKIPDRLRETANVLCRTCDAAWEWARGLGMSDPHPEHRLRALGAWSGTDFAASPAAAFQYDVSDIISVSGGDFDVGFAFDGGAYGAHIERLALYSGEAVVESEDILLSVSRWARWHELRIAAPPVAPDVKRILEVRLRGVPPDAPPNRRTCEGRVGIRQAWIVDERKEE